MINNKILEFGKGLLVFILYLILPSFIAALFLYLKINLNNSFILKNILNISIYLITALVLTFIFRKSLKKQFALFKENFQDNLKVGFKWWGIGLLIMIVGNIFLNLILFKGSIAANEEANRTILKELPIFAFLSMGLIIPYIEELVFRMGFKKSFKNALPFAIFSGLFFGGMHVLTSFELNTMKENWQQFLYIIPYGGLGFAFAYAYFETKNIFTTISIHSIHNILVLITLVLGGI